MNNETIPETFSEAMLTLGERIIPKRLHSDWRTLYPVFHAGELCAFLGMKNGWGKPWELYPIEKAVEPNICNMEYQGYTPASRSICRTGKDHYANTMSRCALDLFPTASQLLAQIEHKKAQIEKARQSLAADYRLQQGQLVSALAGLDELAKRVEGQVLSSTELYALIFIRKDLKKRIADADAMASSPFPRS